MKKIPAPVRSAALAALFVAGSVGLAYAQQAAAPAAPAAPPPPKLDSGDTAWMLTSTALVLLMTIPGLALFYGGMVRKKNVLATMAQTLAAVALGSVLWVIIGYSLAFTGEAPAIGTFDRVMLHGLGIETGVDLARVVEIGQWICGVLGRETGSKAGRALAARNLRAAA